MQISIRTNLLKTTPQNLYKVLADLGFSHQLCNWYPSAAIVTCESVRQLTDTQSFQNGEFYIQNLSSMLPVLALSPKAGQVVLDMCAAPGSKTTQLASESLNKIDIVANDSSKERLYKLKHVLSTQGVENCLVTSYPGQLLWKKYPQYFDAVLLDAPCSMMQNSNESSKKAKLLAPKQRYLLRSALSCCKVGGRIVYSTCSISPIEGEEVINWLLDKNSHSVECNYQVRIQPDSLSEGFFLAHLTKTNSNI